VHLKVVSDVVRMVGHIDLPDEMVEMENIVDVMMQVENDLDLVVDSVEDVLLSRFTCTEMNLFQRNIFPSDCGCWYEINSTYPFLLRMRLSISY
jgi:hypothetical protein